MTQVDPRIEAAARAIYEADTAGWMSPPSWNEQFGPARDRCLETARAALAAADEAEVEADVEYGDYGVKYPGTVPGSALVAHPGGEDRPLTEADTERLREPRTPPPVVRPPARPLKYVCTNPDHRACSGCDVEREPASDESLFPAPKMDYGLKEGL